MKRCCKCQEEKEFACFYRSSKVKDGYSKRCKDCDKVYREVNREKYNLTRQKWCDAHREDNREYHSNYDKEHRKELNDKKIVRRKRLGREEWNYQNRDKINARRKLMREVNPNYKLRDILRNRIRTALKMSNIKKSTKSNELLGCSTEEARKHIESLWKLGMTWENHGFGDDKWHIDHIIPCVAFDFTDIANQKKCFHYTNLQPLWQWENLQKKDKMP